MVSSAGIPPLVGTAARRRRALAHLSPIFDLHLYRARNPSDVDWSAYDFIALVQLTVDTIALSSGLDGNLGAPREFVLIEMTRTAAAMAPQRPTDEHAPSPCTSSITCCATTSRLPISLLATPTPTPAGKLPPARSSYWSTCETSEDRYAGSA